MSDIEKGQIQEEQSDQADQASETPKVKLSEKSDEVKLSVTDLSNQMLNDKADTVNLIKTTEEKINSVINAYRANVQTEVGNYVNKIIATPDFINNVAKSVINTLNPVDPDLKNQLENVGNVIKSSWDQTKNKKR